MYFCVVLRSVCFVSFSVLFMYMRIELSHRVTTQLQLNISYHIYHVINCTIFENALLNIKCEF